MDAKVPSTKASIPKIGVPGIQGRIQDSSSSSEDDRDILKVGKPDLKLNVDKGIGKIGAPSGKIDIPKIGVPGVQGRRKSSSSSSDD